ncbi:MAG: DUF2335 domain-containing protein [Polymorphobacter sp.]
MEQLQPLLKPEKAGEAVKVLRRLTMRVVSKTHSGPIPSAEELEHLERVHAGLANRIVEMAEREQSHRHGMETSIVSHEGSLHHRGQYFALIALALLLGAVAWLAYLGFGVAAASLGTATIVGVVAIFVTGRLLEAEPSSAPEPESKAREEPPKAKPPARRRR